MSWGLEVTASAQRDHSAPPTRPQLPSPAPGQARARRAAEAWGWVCVGRGRRGERHLPKPAGAAQEGCHPLTRGSDPLPLLPGRARTSAKIIPKQRPHLHNPTFTTHQGLPWRPPGPTLPGQMWPQGPWRLIVHQSLERHHLHLLGHEEQKTCPLAQDGTPQHTHTKSVPG